MKLYTHTIDNACPNANYSVLEKILIECQSFQTKTVRFDRKRHYCNKWMTPAILKSVNYKNKLYKNLILNRNNPILYRNLKTNFNIYLKLIKECIRKKNII